MVAVAAGYSNFHGCTLAQDDLTGWVVTLDSTIILKTTDGGISWQEQANPSNRRFFDIECADEQHAWAGGVLGSVYHTSNGIDWAFQVTGISKYVTRFHCLDSNHCWVCAGEGVVARTTDGGQYWDSNFTTNLDEFYGISFTDINRGWIVAGWPDTLANGQGYVARSVDGGILWDSLYRVPGYEDFLDIHMFDTLSGVLVGGDDETHDPIVMKTTNGGLIWTNKPNPSGSYYLRAVDFVGSEGWAVGRYGTIIHTTDAGETWESQDNPATLTLFDVDFSDAEHGLACGNEIILRTTDGGETWHETGIEESNSENARAGLLCVTPNPFRGTARVKWTPGCGKKVELKVFDASGRMVREDRGVMDEAGYALDLRDGTGRTLPNGVYVLMVDDGKTNVSGSITLVR